MTKKMKKIVPAAAGIHEPTNEEIAVRAYLIWEKNGKPHGQDRAYWLQAEAELRAGYTKLPEAVLPTVAVSKPKAKASRTTGVVKSVKSALTKKRW